MRLKLTIPSHSHSKLISGLGWTANNELFTVSDDQTLKRWAVDSDTPPNTVVSNLDVFVTSFDVFSTGRSGGSSTDVLALGCSDGTFKLLNSGGRLEKSVNAHLGAVTGIAFNSNGTELVTAGEDGTVKQWSRSGNLRSKLVVESSPIHSVCWSPDCQAIAYACSRFITIKPLQVSSKPVVWKAHDGTVTCLDWNSSTGVLVSGGEDCRYRVWDSYGLQLYASKPFESILTAVKWCPNGDSFAVGFFNTILLCDRSGWIHSRSSADCGSVYSFQWTMDGSHVAAAGANGKLVFGQIVDREMEWKNYTIRLNEDNRVLVFDALAADSTVPSEELEFGSRVIEFSIRYGFLVVATLKSCYVYPTNSFSTPQLFDHNKGSISVILQSERYFALIDKSTGIAVFSYDGRQISKPQLPSNATVSFQHLKNGNISMSNDCLAILDRQANGIHLLDLETGKKLSEPIRHPQGVEIAAIGLNQTGLVSERKLYVIDRNHDLWLTLIHKSSLVKLAAQVDCASWNDSFETLAAISDNKFTVWYYPSMIYLDRDLVALCQSHQDVNALGRNAEFLTFADSRAVVRRSDGALQCFGISTSSSSLFKFCSSNQWGRAARLCRFVDDPILWAVLAGLALNGQQLDIAEIALAAIDQIEKVQYIQSIKLIPSQEGRNAELALYKRLPDQAEQILLAADLKYRAIKMNINIFRWHRALELAQKFNIHVDTVVAYRQAYLQSLEREESDPKFLALRDSVSVDWGAISGRIEAELKREQQRGQPYKSTIQLYEDITEKFIGSASDAVLAAHSPQKKPSRRQDDDEDRDRDRDRERERERERDKDREREREKERDRERDRGDRDRGDRDRERRKDRSDDRHREREAEPAQQDQEWGGNGDEEQF